MTTTPHGTLHDYRTGDPVRPATREEREWSLDAMLEGYNGTFQMHGRSYYVTGCPGVVCVDERYAGPGFESFDNPQEFLHMVADVWREELPLQLRCDGWHGPDGLVLQLAEVTP